jgi:hypothetical protein
MIRNAVKKKQYEKIEKSHKKKIDKENARHEKFHDKTLKEVKDKCKAKKNRR